MSVKKYSPLIYGYIHGQIYDGQIYDDQVDRH